ncbi:MAG: hypothetical protein UY37_C0009G0004 [Candidatus Beckwithbacteria bacterium GW2011_GWC2_49_11]|nr:MAG: hypothetical protein UY43_C0001G0252 [Candidatus Beckwithbacteria bacterium GW2011_GWC1_49_16]KKW02930.1 MAG: hypothetical protein UY37_C0009G0004 [Candidatus Beckwithbacteria bacterium GW2011_GWC2_49_11]
MIKSDKLVTNQGLNENSKSFQDELYEIRDEIINEIKTLRKKLKDHASS